MPFCKFHLTYPTKHKGEVINVRHNKSIGLESLPPFTLERRETLSYNDNSPDRQGFGLFGYYFDKVYRWYSGNQGTFYYILIVVIALLWLASGVYIVQPGEEGVVQTYGRFSNITTPGVNYHVPWPFQRVTIVEVERIRRAEIGFRTLGTDSKEEVLSEALMLTTDENIVQVELLVQYRIADSRAFVFNVQNP
jgi:hypothetical protein